MAPRSLRPQLNQIRAWVRQGRTDAWIAHQLEVSVKDLRQFKRDHELEAPEADSEGHDDEDLRAADDELVAAALESESDEDEEDDEGDEGDEGGDSSEGAGGAASEDEVSDPADTLTNEAGPGAEVADEMSGLIAEERAFERERERE